MTSISDAGSPGGTFSFTYDALGNLTNDGRKGLVISYNVLNLPRSVATMASGSLTYTYLSDGTKVSAIKSDGSGERYLGSFVYSVPSSGSETLESAAWDEGRVSFAKAGSSYLKSDLWFVKDHLGNVRTVVNVIPSLSSPQVLERNDYLPFGTRMDAGTAVIANNRFRLGGKESQTFGSLDLGKVDFGARMYDPFTARWTTADPLAAKYGSMSPYGYCGGNTVNLIDPNGLDIWEISKKGRIVKHTVDKSTDAFYLVNKLKNGSFVRSGESVFFNYGTVLENQSQFSDEKNAVFDWFIVRGDSAAESLFKFFADNTTVEWSWLSMGKKGESGFNVMSSSHNNNRDEAMSYLIRNRFQYGYFLRIHTHSHPNSIPYLCFHEVHLHLDWSYKTYRPNDCYVSVE